MKEFFLELFESIPNWGRLLVIAVMIAIGIFFASCATTLTHRMRLVTPEGSYLLVDSLDSSTRQLR